MNKFRIFFRQDKKDFENLFIAKYCGATNGC
jgi:hypothetical protein